jgi:hypothetical protein
MEFPGNKLLKSFSLGLEEVRCAAAYLEASGLDYMMDRDLRPNRPYNLLPCAGVAHVLLYVKELNL